MMSDVTLIVLITVASGLLGAIAGSFMSYWLGRTSATVTVTKEEPSPEQRTVWVDGRVGFVLGLVVGVIVGVLYVLASRPGPTPQPSATPAVSVERPTSGPTPTDSGPSHEPGAYGCPERPFLGWQQLVRRDPSGTYAIHLAKCDLLWFNSGSIQLGEQRLGGEAAEQNTVLLYLASTETTVEVSIGDPKDLGNEWIATTRAGFDQTIAAWAPRALDDANCLGGCAKLLLLEYVDGQLVGNNMLSSPPQSGACEAVPVGVLTPLQTKLWQLGGGYLQVEFYIDEQPERDTILPLDLATAGYRVLTPLKGYVWSYPLMCGPQDVRDSTDVHIADRIGGGYKNQGYVDWRETGLFQPISSQ